MYECLARSKEDTKNVHCVAKVALFVLVLTMILLLFSMVDQYNHVRPDNQSAQGYIVSNFCVN
jgi:hypothetical protein